ncbi:LOW QUALITY PROTEIN: polyketide synthase modules [Vibrio sp. JCM 19052]|nr:LOW QUALITY PROTEIN: polyketide synthase modules [Vibrio sp. JCM 19052]
MWKGLLATLFAISVTACTTVTTDVDKQADFSSYKTFDFGEQSETPTSLDARRIEQGLAAQLESKGLSRVQSGGDLYVHHDIIKESELVSSGSSFSVGYGWNSFGVITSSLSVIKRRSMASLLLNLSTPKLNQVVWKGVSSRKLTESMSTEKREELISEEVMKMFENYPYGKK